MSDNRIDLTKFAPPSEPGVYFFRDGRKRPIYIGKAKSLADRLSSYAQKNLEFRTLSMLHAAKALDWIVLNSDIEALLCEAAMIRTYQPRYNVMLRDDKRFPMILITDEPYPKALKIRKARPGQGRHFGPFRGGTANHLLEIISRRFKIRRCSGPLPKRKRPCIDFDIGRCDGMCVGNLGREGYAELVERAAQFLAGDTAVITAALKDEMAFAATERDYEKAAGLRDEIAALEMLAEKQEAEKPVRADADAIAVALSSNFAAGIVLERRNGVVVECRRYQFDLPLDSEPSDILRRTFFDHYRERQPPRVVLVSEAAAADELSRIASALFPRQPIKVHSPIRGDDAALIRLAAENADEAVRVESRDRSVSARNLALAELARVLELDPAPRTIEGFDISTTSGRETVGACVLFAAGIPKKAGYRLYRIRGRQDSDVDAIAEIIARRSSAKEALPDMILIDGGMGQLNAARQALESAAPKKMPVLISLAKREELVMTTEGEIVRFERNSPALQLLQHVRDEAHRFGRKYHRKLRGKASVRGASRS